MASRHRLKKEIDYIVSDLVYDCFTFINMRQQENNEDVLQIVQETLTMRNDLRVKTNHPENKAEGQSTKNYYDEIAKELVSSVEGNYEKLSQMVNPKA